jgi:hypothetical protein
MGFAPQGFCEKCQYLFIGGLWIAKVIVRNRNDFTQTLIDPSKEVDLEVNTQKTKYMLLSCHQNAGQNHDIKTGNMF